MDSGRLAVDRNFCYVADFAEIEIPGKLSCHVDLGGVGGGSHEVLVGFDVLQVLQIGHGGVGNIFDLGILEDHFPVLYLDAVRADRHRLVFGGVPGEFVEHEHETLRRAEFEMNLAVGGNLQRMALAGSRVVDPSLASFGDRCREGDVGGAALAHVGIHEQEEIAAVIHHKTVLQQEAVGIADGYGVGQVVLLHDIRVPFQIVVAFRSGQDGEIAGSLQFGNDLRNLGVALLEIAESYRLGRSVPYAEHPASAEDELANLLHCLQSGAFHRNQEQHAILLGTVAKFPAVDCGIFQDALGYVVRTASVLVDGLPYEGCVRDIQFYGERFGLDSHLRPHVIVGGEDGDVGIHVGIAHQGAQPGPVVVQQFPIGPPGVLLVIVASVLHPSGERSFLGGVVETVPYGMCDAGDAAHVGADFQQFQRSGEYLVGVCHLLATHETLSGKMRCGGDILVYHSIGSSAAVVLVAHLLANAVTQPVGGPGLSFGNVQAHRGLFYEESAAVALRAGLDPFLAGPLLIHPEETFVQEFSLGEFEIEADAVDLLLELFSLLATVVEVEHVAKTPDLEHGERQPRHDVIPSAGFELLGEVACPVCAFELHAVHEECAEMLRERSKPGLDPVGHAVEVLAHGFGVHVVEDGTCRSGRPVDDAGEGIVLHHVIHLPLAGGDLHLEDVILESVRHVDRLAEVVDGIRNQQGFQKLWGTPGIGNRYTRVQLLENVEFGFFVERSSSGLVTESQNYGSPFIARKVLRSERPAGSDDEVACHPELFRFVKGDPQHVDPFVAQPYQGFLADRVLLPAGEGYGIDFHAGDSSFLQQIEFPADFSFVYAVAVPPPAYVGPVGVGRVLEGLPDGF